MTNAGREKLLAWLDRLEAIVNQHNKLALEVAEGDRPRARYEDVVEKDAAALTALRELVKAQGEGGEVTSEERGEAALAFDNLVKYRVPLTDVRIGKIRAILTAPRPKEPTP